MRIFQQKPISMWTGDGTFSKNYIDVLLYQCPKCTHIFQSLSSDDLNKVEAVYKTKNAQASTQLGDGNWGKVRAKKFLKFIPKKNYISVLEIGCGNGHLLKYFQTLDVSLLVGIEPSLSKSYSSHGIEYIKDYVTKDLSLGKKFDLIISSAVFEHIDAIVDTLKFCHNHLNDKGILYFSVPNSELDMEKFDPAMFAHEHLHYFSKQSITTLCEISSFEVINIYSENDSIYASVKRAISDTKKKTKESQIQVHQNSYQESITHSIKHTQKLFDTYYNILIHGATNATYNMLQWADLTQKDFTLIDNDSEKHSKQFFNKTIYSLDELEVTKYDCIIIAPLAYYQEIKDEYLLHNFTNNIFTFVAN